MTIDNKEILSHVDQPVFRLVGDVADSVSELMGF